MTTRRELKPADLKRVLDAERAGAPFLLWQDGEARVQILQLDGRDAVTIGRRSSCDVALSEDSLVSRTHARLERIGEDWVLLDDGISRNGSFLNGKRATRYERLADGDRIRFGATVVEYRNQRLGTSAVTSASVLTTMSEQLTPTQRRIVVALCRPLRDGGPYATPASNPEIAREVFLGVDAVKAHLRELYRRFDIDLPQNQKRGRLAEQALQLGLEDGR